MTVHLADSLMARRRSSFAINPDDVSIFELITYNAKTDDEDGPIDGTPNG